MKKLIWSLAAAGMMVGAASTASAAEGCGAGWHRGPYGHCRPNRPRVMRAPATVVIGTYYPGRGWWDGGRYRWHRYRWHGGWRYR